MRCYECFHYNVCGSSGMYTDAGMCKQALPVSKVIEFKEKLEKVLRDNKELKIELDYAQDCINDVEDALYRGNKNDWAQNAIDKYNRRHDDSL